MSWTCVKRPPWTPKVASQIMLRHNGTCRHHWGTIQSFLDEPTCLWHQGIDTNCWTEAGVPTVMVAGIPCSPFSQQRSTRGVEKWHDGSEKASTPKFAFAVCFIAPLLPCKRENQKLYSPTPAVPVRCSELESKICHTATMENVLAVLLCCETQKTTSKGLSFTRARKTPAWTLCFFSASSCVGMCACLARWWAHPEVSCLHEALRYLKTHQPAGALFENVVAMSSHVEAAKSGLEVLREQAMELGYYTCVREIALEQFHMAQRRRRECSVNSTTVASLLGQKDCNSRMGV